ncbi:MAG TPA: DUF411 domain-containing protein [Longimicrobiaceae bacterium]|nr:DUF411 domain-containing protein [Longimicrobiaceae bacterium]
MKIPVKRRIPGAAALVLIAALIAGCNAESAGGSRDAATALSAQAEANRELPVMTVYKNPSCRCCGEWAEYMRESGFRLEIKEAGMNLGHIKAQHGVPPQLASCHTALVGGYVLEGHVPADVVQKLLEDQLQVAGVAVPGMPAGVPGMPEAGPDRDPYEIIAFERDGDTRVYTTR